MSYDEHVSDLTKDSELYNWGIYKLSDSDWFIHNKEQFLLEDGSTLEVGDELPEEASYKSISAVQNAIMKHGQDKQATVEDETEEIETNSQDETEEQTSDIEENGTEEDDGEDRDIDDIFNSTTHADEEETRDDSLNNTIENEDDSESDSIIDGITSYFETDDQKEEKNDEDNVVDDDSESDSIIDGITSYFETDEASYDVKNETPEDIDDEDIDDEDIDDEDSVIDQIISYLDDTQENDEDIDNTEVEKTVESEDSEKTTDESSNEETTDSADGSGSKLSFLNKNLSDVNQKRPDAQNVILDFISIKDGFGWSEEVHNLFNKLQEARTDEIVRRDVVDFSTRYKALLKQNKYARGDAIDMLWTLTLAIFGIAIFLLSLLVLLIGSDSAVSVVFEPSGYGDIMVFTTLILGAASTLFWLSRRSKNKKITSGLKKPVRFGFGALLVSQVLLLLWISYHLTIGGGQEGIYQLELYWWSLINNTVPSALPEAARTYWETGLDTFGSITPIGLGIFEASILMILFSMSAAIPVTKRSAARIVLTVNMGPAEFREKTGILAEQINYSESDDDLDLDFDYDLGDEETENDFDQTLVELSEDVLESPFAGYTEKRRYWVKKPYTYISIVYKEEQNDYRYVVVEPELDDSEEVLFDELRSRLDDVLLFEDVEEKEDHEEELLDKLESLENRTIELSEEYDIELESQTFHRILYYIERDYVRYNKIDPLINDPYIEDISCDGEGEYIFIFHKHYKDILTNVKFEREELQQFVQELAQRSGEHISAADPMVDASLPDGSRAQMTLGSEVTTRGSTFTIRLFEEIPFTPVDLLDYDTFSTDQMAYLWLAIQKNKSLIFAGGTASGKTTSMNAVSMFIPPKSKVITIEDTREIKLPQDNWIPGTTRDSLGEDGDDIDMYELLRAALRQRPEYIVVGEIRGAEAETLFQAMNTGHTTYSTMHAETVGAAIGRLTNPPINVPKQMVTALDIVCIQNQIRFTDEDGNAKNVRRNQEIREIVGLKDNGEFDNRRPFQWDPETDTFVQSLNDSNVLAEIQEENGWTREERRAELQRRKTVLDYMIDEDIREFEQVTNIIQAYMVDKEKTVQEIESGELEPKNLSNLTDLEWDEPDKSLEDIKSETAPAGDD